MDSLKSLKKCIRLLVPNALDAEAVRLRILFQNKVWPRPWPEKKSYNRDGINVFGFHSVSFGLGQGVRSTTEILNCAGAQLKLFDFTHNELVESLFNSLHRDAVSKYGVNLCQVNPQEMNLLVRHFGPEFFMHRYNIGYWVWEQHPTTRDWRRACAYVDEIWVPSDYVRQAALAGGVKKKIRVIPHCVELPCLPEKDIRAEIGIPQTASLLLCLFDMASTEERKNPLATLRTIRLATAGMHDVFVVVKVREPHMNPSAMREIKNMLDGINHLIITDIMEKTDLLSLIKNSSAYVSLHRSEGFGLFLAEAMALGKPVVATGYSGNMDYMTPENSFPVAYKLIQCPEKCHPYQKGFWWAEPDENDAVRLVRDILTFPEKAASIGEKAREDMRHNFSAQAIAKLAKKALREIGITTIQPAQQR